MKRSPMPRGNSFKSRGGFTSQGKGIKRSRMRGKTDPKLEAWSRAVKKRDKYYCHWPGCFRLGPGVTIDAHHKALRSARPDLKYDVSNGITVCRAHHAHIHGEGREDAIRLGFLNLETYEQAMKEGRNAEPETCNS